MMPWNTRPRCRGMRSLRIYTHLSDMHGSFHTRVLSATSSEAPYVLDGLMYHESNLAVEERYTDMADFTDHVFGLMPLLGFRFAPHIQPGVSIHLDMRLHAKVPLVALFA